MMSRLLGPDEVRAGSPTSPGEEDDQYFPDRQEKRKVAAGVNIFAEVTSTSEFPLIDLPTATDLNVSLLTLTVPLDLLASLVNTFVRLLQPISPLRILSELTTCSSK